MTHFHFENRLTESDRGLKFLGRIDVRVKMFALFLSLLLCVSSRRIEVPSVFAVFAIVMMFWGGLSLKEVGVQLSAPFSVAGLVILIQPFLHDGEVLLHFPLLKWTFVATQEGLFSGLLIAVKVLSASALIWNFISFTPSRYILSAIQWIRVPDVILELIAMMFRYLFVLLETGSTIKEAQTLRLGYSSYRRGLRSAVMLIHVLQYSFGS
ncbi:TPA: hypothetical protein EYP66_03380 [Candidatus Poribacteria bacterium]|nr:hypothetical protein [Candidatus Poribacteria bacterium]